jgi:hypothetical protein
MQSGGRKNKAAAIATKLDGSQIALCANLVAIQFESGLASTDRENRFIGRGCLKRKRIRRPEQGEK